MKLSDYIKISKLWIISSLFSLLIIDLILVSSININKSINDILYMNFLVISIEVMFILYGYLNERKKYDNLKEYKAPEEIKEGDFYLKKLKEVENFQKKEFLKKEEFYKNNTNELQDYITKWVHDIKVDIAVCNLLIEEEDNREKLYCEIEKIKFKVNQVLNVTRANHYNQDITPEEINVCKELRNVIRENSILFINKNIEIDADLTEFQVISDKKWIDYIFTQIINNSSKYTEENGRVSIYTKEDKKAYYVCIKDNGIGISKEDINRIFDKGFTGKNGRKGSSSTGMGLYYVKKIAGKLNIEIDVESKEKEYTEFTVRFNKKDNFFYL